MLAAYIGCEVCTASRNADAIIKLYVVFHTPVKHARRINAAQAAAYVDHAIFAICCFHLSCNKLYTCHTRKVSYNLAQMPEILSF